LKKKGKPEFVKETSEETKVQPGFESDLEERVRSRAYELYERRGCIFGRDLEDWFQAEQEILGKRVRSEAA